jgi:hypothetical protein
MRGQTAATFLTCWLATAMSSTTAHAQSPGSPASEALRFFDIVPPGEVSAILRELRPSPISPDERARALAVLPAEGELPPDAKERAKLSALEALLVYHERQGLFDIKVIDVPQAVVGLHQRAVLLISRPALRFLSASELQALVAHEIGHEYFWKDYENARARHDRRGRQELELRCDGIAVLTLISLGLDPARLADGIRKMTEFNEILGATANADEYPPVQDRLRFARALLRMSRP